MNTPLNSEYTITGYHMQREEIYGHMASTANQRYDLMELVMVCLERFEHKEKGTKLHQLLSTVLSENLTPQEKIEVIKRNTTWCVDWHRSRNRTRVRGSRKIFEQFYSGRRRFVSDGYKE